MIRVGVVGAAGRMGGEVCRVVAATNDLELAGAVDPSHAGEEVAGGLVVADSLNALSDAGVEVAVEFSGPASVGRNVVGLLERGIHVVVGATGMSPDDLDRIRELAEDGAVNAVVAPNFAIGAVLMLQFAASAARHLPHAEVIELHHDGKVDAPSGTALRTADLIAGARAAAPQQVLGDDAYPGARGADRDGVRVHAVRLPGLVAHQEVIFGAAGQTLRIRHDVIDRGAFMPGVLLAIRRVADLDGLVVGLEHLL